MILGIRIGADAASRDAVRIEARGSVRQSLTQASAQRLGETRALVFLLLSLSLSLSLSEDNP